MGPYCPVCGEEPFFGVQECTACYEPCCEDCTDIEGVCRECVKVGIT